MWLLLSMYSAQLGFFKMLSCAFFSFTTWLSFIVTYARIVQTPVVIPLQAGPLLPLLFTNLLVFIIDVLNYQGIEMGIGSLVVIKLSILKSLHNRKQRIKRRTFCFLPFIPTNTLFRIQSIYSSKVHCKNLI